MTRAPNPDDARDATEDESDDFLAPQPIESTSRIKDPADDPANWHLCGDFLDRLADELEEWLSKSDPTVEDVEALEWFAVGMDGVGPDACVNAWRRARVDLTAILPGAVRDTLEAHVQSLAKRARKVLGEVADFPKDGEEAGWRDVALRSFSEQAVRPCLQHLRDCSIVVQKKLPIPREASEQPAKADPLLAERARLVLTALLEDAAIDSDHRMTTDEIAKKAAGGNADPNQYKEVIVQLKSLGYVATKEGRSGGCWLTASGQTRARKL